MSGSVLGVTGAMINKRRIPDLLKLIFQGLMNGHERGNKCTSNHF